MRLSLEYVPVRKLTKAVRNPKRHDTDSIQESMDRLGFIDPGVIDERTGRLVSGHGRLETLLSAMEAHLQAPDGIEVDDDGEWLMPVSRGWFSADDAEAEVAIITLNRQVERGGWDLDELAEMLQSLQKTEAGLMGVGFFDDELAELLADLIDPNENQGNLLALSDVSFGEPSHKVAKGDVFRLGPHTLVIADVLDGWPTWAPYLVGDAVFAPYAGPYVALTKKAAQRPVVLVQPDPFLAGHVLDKYEAMKGADDIELVLAGDSA